MERTGYSSAQTDAYKYVIVANLVEGRVAAASDKIFIIRLKVLSRLSENSSMLKNISTCFLMTTFDSKLHVNIS